MKKLLPLALGLLLLASLPAALLAAPPSPSAAGFRAGQVGVMTQNLYVGADIFRVFDAQTPQEIPLVVSQILGTVFATDFPARARAIAAEIAHSRPHLVGLQEVSLIRVQSPGDFLLGNPTPAQTVLFDYLDILLDALEEAGVSYHVAAEVDNADVELPFVAGFDGGVPQLDDVRLTDRDVVLARSDVSTSHAVGRNYAINVVLPIAGTTIEFLRGYAAVDATVKGRTYRFVSTHLEVGSSPPAAAVQAAQMQELLGELHGEPLPVILVGDLNSAPDDPPTQPYAQALAEGYVDTWLERVGPPASGFTCCQTETLDDPVSQLDERIDHVFVRNDSGFPAFSHLGPVRSRVVGDEPADRTPSGLWPSDHAGVAARLILPSAKR